MRYSMPKCCNHHHGIELPMWCSAENTTLFLLFLMLAVIHLNWLVQQRPERPICSFLSLQWHNVRCHSPGGPQVGSPVTDDRYPTSLPPWNLFTKLRHTLFTASLLENPGVDRLGQREQENERQRGQKSSVIHETVVRFVPVFEKL